MTVGNSGQLLIADLDALDLRIAVQSECSELLDEPLALGLVCRFELDSFFVRSVRLLMQ